MRTWRLIGAGALAFGIAVPLWIRQFRFEESFTDEARNAFYEQQDAMETWAAITVDAIDKSLKALAR